MKHQKPRADLETPLGQRGTIGTGQSGQKPREKAARQASGKPTQGRHSGHELCNIGKCDH